MRRRLSELAGTPRKAQITARSGDPLHNGFILGVSDELLLLHQFHDFLSEGYLVLPIAEITTVRSDEHERFWEKMFEREGIAGAIGMPEGVDLAGIEALARSLMARGGAVTITEACDDDEDEEEPMFYLGRIEAVDEDLLSLRYLDTFGKWGAELDRVVLDRILAVEFQTPYLINFSRHAETPPSKLGMH